jgi:hypothetical protein
LLFVGINPKGSRYEPPLESVEEGNAYRVERWGPGGGLSSIQVQVQTLYGVLSEKLDHEPVAELMDATMAANFCPFRSPSCDALPKKAQSVDFSRRLWSYLFGHISPSVIICLTDIPFRHFEEVLRGKGYRRIEMLQGPVGWGNVSYSQARYVLDQEDLLLLRLPHLSRYRILGRPQSRMAIERFTDAIVQALLADI